MTISRITGILQLASAITYNWDAVREFAGEDYEAAVVPEKVRKILSRFDERSQHYEVVVEQTGEKWMRTYYPD